MRKRALLAIAFAGGIINSQLSALAQPTYESNDSIIQLVEANNQMSPQIRAYYLLLIANGYLTGSKKSEIDQKYRPMLNKQNRFWLFHKESVWENILVTWADQLSSEGRSPKTAQDKGKPVGPETKNLADEAIKSAFTELEQVTDPFSKLHLYFIASRLCQKVGKTDGMQKCNRVIDESLKSCESSSPADEKQIKGGAALLDAKAFGFIPVEIPNRGKNDAFWAQQKADVKSFTETEFKESEKLKLRAAAMADRLPKDSHVRRKVHRDLTLWYMQLGKMAQADKEKQALYELVGFKDDSVLYPQSEGCGTLVWWKQKQNLPCYACGMG